MYPCKRHHLTCLIHWLFLWHQPRLYNCQRLVHSGKEKNFLNYSDFINHFPTRRNIMTYLQQTAFESIVYKCEVFFNSLSLSKCFHLCLLCIDHFTEGFCIIASIFSKSSAAVRFLICVNTCREFYYRDETIVICLPFPQCIQVI